MMNKVRAQLLLVFVASVVTLQAAADDLPHSFFGFEKGHGHTYLSGSGADSIIAKDKTLRVYSGVSLNQNFSTEVGVVDFGESSAHFTVNDETVRQESRAVYVSAVGVIPSETAKWLVSVGYDWWNASYLTTATIVGAPVYGQGSGSGHNFHYGAGMDIPLGDNTSIRVNWQRYRKIGDGVTVSYQSMPSITQSGGDITVIDAGLLVRF